MVDITKHLSNLNLKLQGKDQIITTINDHIKAFKCKLDLWEIQLQNENLTHFPTCMTYKTSYYEPIFYKTYSEQIICLKTEFGNRFQDLKYLENDFKLFTSSFSIDAVKVPAHIQMELIEIQNDSNIKRKFNEVGVPNFYNFLPVRYVETHRFTCKIKSMFSSTYLCEQLFSLMNSNKSSVRSRLTDIHLNSVLKVASSNNISPEIEKLVEEKRCQISSKKNY
jgi:hypothetical protein